MADDLSAAIFGSSSEGLSESLSESLSEAVSWSLCESSSSASAESSQESRRRHLARRPRVGPDGATPDDLRDIPPR